MILAIFFMPMMEMTNIRVCSYVIIFRVCLCLQLVNLSITVCREECFSEVPRMHISMQPGKSITVCLDYIDYRLKDLALLDTNCNSLDNYVHPSVNATYICNAVNVTRNTSFNARTCEQLVSIECVRKLPITVSGCDGEDFSDDGDEEERGCGGKEDDDSDGIDYNDDEGGGDSSVDDNGEDDFLLGLLLESTNQYPKSFCNVFINVAMDDPGFHDDDLCSEVTSESFGFCLKACINSTFNNVDICSELADSILEKSSVEDEDVDAVVDILSALTLVRGSVSSLNATIEIIGNLVDMLVVNSSLVNTNRGQVLTSIIDETLSEMRFNEWQNLQQGADQYRSSRLLNSLEMISFTLANVAINQSNFLYRGNSIQMLAVKSVSEEDVLSGVYHFPAEEDINGLTRLEIPRRVLCTSNQRKGDDENTGCSAVVSAAIVQNLPSYLDQTSNISSNFRTNSLLMSVSIQNTDKEVNTESLLEDFPIVIHFTALEDTASLGESECVFWNFTNRRWSGNGLTTIKHTNSNVIRCVSTHLTSFAVLVDVSSKKNSNDAALKLVSYIGCVVSLICLSLSLLILVYCGKQLKKGVLLYVHVNFIIALGLALLVFVTGIQTAARIKELCAAVAALLHYLFLCVFCWMLAEGIMLYLLVVRVFGTVASKWYYLLILGWGLPVPIVVISAGVRFNEYGKGDFCWLPTSSGTVWSFLGPMMAIIVVNSIILVLTLRSLLRGKKFRQNANTCKPTKLMLVWSALKSTVILLPLLGVTWIIGVFAINENTTVFAWMFTVLNSLQGLFIFVFHVLRNDKVWGSMKQAFRHPLHCCSCEITQRRGDIIKRSKSNSVTMATTNTNCQELEHPSESTDHPIIGRSYSETSQDSTLELANYIVIQKQI